jgi:replicative DNA helicase
LLLSEYAALVDMPEARQLMGTQWKALPKPEALPAFPLHTVASPCREMVEAVAMSLQVDPGMAACFLLAVASAAMLGRVSIRVYGDYYEYIQLQIAICANPSERKSAVISYMDAPLREYIQEENKRRKPDIDRQAARLNMLRKQWEGAARKGHESDLMQLTDEISAAEANAANYIELLLTDTTPEALGAFMARNLGCAAILSGEGGIINVLAGAYSEQVNMDVILKGYSGEPVAVERIGRAPVRIERAALTIGIAVQPQLLSQFLSNEVLRGRGLHARFLYAMPSSMVGRRVVRDAVSVPETVKLAYACRIRELAKLQSARSVYELTLSSGALDAYYTWAQEVENQSGPGGLLDGVADGWGGKLAGNTVRIAGVLKMLENPDPAIQIQTHHMASAIEIARYFMAHTLTATGRNMGMTHEAAEVLEEIKRQRQEAFKPSSVRQKLRFRSRFKADGAVDFALLELEKTGYIRHGAMPAWNGIGRPPEALYEAHPDLFGTKPEVMEL